jgi:mevalonate pyrophosphate decarboxylase
MDDIPMKQSTAVAYPGLPLIFAEGYRGNRLSMHGHISLALTSVDGLMRTETTGVKSPRAGFLVDGRRLSGRRGAGMLGIVKAMAGKSESHLKLNIFSRNHGILTGSSDSGAAALAVALNDFFGLRLSLDELHKFARLGSETAYRSLYGGLSEYYFLRGVPKARRLADAEDLQNLAIYAVPFSYGRYSADVLHKAVVRHPEYDERIIDAERRIIEFKKNLAKSSLTDCLQLMEDDARQVHGMFEDMGFAVRKKKMLELCNSVERWRSGGIECYWNVAGGSVVYVISTSGFRRSVFERLREFKPVECRVAGPAVVL